MNHLFQKIGLTIVASIAFLFAPTVFTFAADTSFEVGPMGSDVTTHQLVRTAEDKVYMFGYPGDFSHQINGYWTTSAGLPTTATDFGGNTIVNEPEGVISVDTAYDGVRFIHVIANTVSGNVKDYPFDTTTNTFRTPITLANDAAHSQVQVGTEGVSSMFSAGGTLHLSYWATGNHILYRSFTYDSVLNTITPVSGPTQVDGAESSAGGATHPSLAVSPVNGDVFLSWVVGQNGAGNLYNKVLTAGTWGNATKINASALWTSPNAGVNIDQGPATVMSYDGTLHLLYMQDWENVSGQFDYGRVHYVTRTPAGVWSDQSLPIFTHDPSLAIDASDRLYVLGHGHPFNANTTCTNNEDMCLTVKNATGWGNTQLFAVHPVNGGFDTSVSTKWSAVGFNRPDAVEFIFPNTINGSYVNTTIFYNRIDTAPIQTPTPTPIPTATPTPTATPSPSPSPTPTTVTATFAISSDDRDAWSGNAHAGNPNHEVRVSGYSSTEKMDFVSNDSDEETAAMQFALTIPKGATIQSAYFTVKAGSFQNPSPTGSMDIALYDNGNVPAFQNGFFGDLANLYPTYPQTVGWNAGASGWTTGALKTSADVSSLVQTFINRTDYQTGNYAGFVITNGTIENARYYGWEDFAAGGPATLTVTYTTDVVATPTPTPTPTITPTPTATPTPIPSITPTPTPTPSPTPTATPTPTPTVTPTPTPTLTPSPSPSPTPTSITITKSISSSTDDANQDGSAVNTTSTTIWTGTAASASSSYLGLRFTGLQIPKNAQIISARVDVYSSQSQWQNMGMSIAADNVGNSVTFSSTAKPSTRALTTSKVTHSSNVSWAANTWYALNDISSVVQEIVNRADWNSGNSMSVIMKGTGGSWGRKFIQSYNGSAANAPRLVVTFR